MVHPLVRRQLRAIEGIQLAAGRVQPRGFGRYRCGGEVLQLAVVAVETVARGDRRMELRESIEVGIDETRE